MDPANWGDMRWGRFRWGMNSYAINKWIALINQFDGIATCNVTRRRLKLTFPRDSVTGHRNKTFSEDTVKGILIPKVANHLALKAGTYVRTDAMFIAVNGFKNGDEIYANGVYYEVKGVKNHYIGNSFFRRELDLTVLPFHE